MQEAGVLAALLGRAFENEHWDAPGTELELFADNTVVGTLVAATADKLVATASLQLRAPDATPEAAGPTGLQDGPCGWLRWVATEQDWRRAGLARALVIDVLGLAAESGCGEVRLKTETDRLGAIKLYLQLGFEPLIVEKDMEVQAWQLVQQLLDTQA